MKKSILITVLLLIATQSFSGNLIDRIKAKRCSRCPVQTIVRDSIIERFTVRDSTITIPADSSWYFALLECDSLGNVQVVKEETNNSGQSSITTNLTPVKPKTPGKGKPQTQFRADCKCDSSSIFITWLERNKEHYQNTQITLPPKYIPMPLSKMQKYFLKSGKIFNLLILALIIGFVGKWLLRAYLPGFTALDTVTNIFKRKK